MMENFLLQVYLESQWLIETGVILAITTLAHVGLRVLFGKLAEHFRFAKASWKISLVQALRFPVMVLVWVLGITLSLDVIFTHFSKLDFFQRITLLEGLTTHHFRQAAFVFCLCWFLLRWKSGIEEEVLKRVHPEHPFEKVQVRIVGRLITVMILLTAMIWGLQTLGFDIKALLAMGGVGSLILGFASKDVISNFFGGFMIFFTRPFLIGDWVRSPEKQIEGIVEEIGWYYTCIRGFNKQPIYVPNSVFPTIVVINPSRMSHWRLEERFGIQYKDFHAVRPVIDDIKEMLQNHPDLDPTQERAVYLDKLRETHLELVIIAYTTAIKKHEYAKIKQDILLRIGEIIKKHDLEFALPSYQLHVEQFLRTFSQAES